MVAYTRQFSKVLEDTMTVDEAVWVDPGLMSGAVLSRQPTARAAVSSYLEPFHGDRIDAVAGLPDVS